MKLIASACRLLCDPGQTPADPKTLEIERLFELVNMPAAKAQIAIATLVFHAWGLNKTYVIGKVQVHALRDINLDARSRQTRDQGAQYDPCCLGVRTPRGLSAIRVLVRGPGWLRDHDRRRLQ